LPKWFSFTGAILSLFELGMRKILFQPPPAEAGVDGTADGDDGDWRKVVDAGLRSPRGRELPEVVEDDMGIVETNIFVKE